MAATRDKILLWGNGSEPSTADPATETAAIESTISSALFEGLVNIGIDGKTILPGVAERWEISPDKLRYTFHLRADARWSDGTPVKADDFAFAFRRDCEPSTGCELVDCGYSIVGVRDYANGRNRSPASLGFRAIDPRTFEVRVAHPAPYLLFVLGANPWLPVPRAVVERFGQPFAHDNPWSKPGNMVSNGAFTLKSWQPNSNVTVAKNPFYWDRAHVRLEQVRFFPTDNPDAEERGFRAGEYHITFRVPQSKLAGYAADPNGVLRVSPQLASWFVVFNTTRPPFDKVAVRRAFALAIDRDRIVPAVLLATGTPAHSLTRPGTGGCTFPAVTDYDPALAKRLLDAAGYPGGAGFPAIEFTVRNSGTDPLVSEALQDAWRKVLGVTVNVGQVESKVAINKFYAHDFQLALSGWFSGVDSPEFVLTLARGGSPSNMAAWRNPDFDLAFTAAENAPSPAAHAAAIRTMEKILFAEAPYCPIYYFNQCQLVSPMLHGWRGNLLQQTDWRELWLGDEKL